MPPPTSMRRESPQPSPGAAPPSGEPTTTSDNESGGEKPVREKLRDTRIANHAMEDEMTTSPGAGPVRRKRSFEDVQDDDDGIEEPGKPGKHARKRSRSSTPEDRMDETQGGTAAVTNGIRDHRSLTPELSSDRAEEAQPAGLASPKNKRTRDQVLKDDETASPALGEGHSAMRAADKDNKLPGDDRQTKRHRDSGSPEPVKLQGTTKIPASSGFANTSAASPFGALISNPAKVDIPQTSESKFASSGFGKLANASASPFAAAKGPSAFGASASATKSAFTAGNVHMQPSAFGSSGSVFGGRSSSVFGAGSGASAFGSNVKPASAFGSSFAKPGISSFAGGSGPKIEGISDKPAKAFGAADESDEEPEEDDEEDDGEGHKSPGHVTTDEAIAKKDKRFYEQEVETGEEGETTLFTNRAKLFSYIKNEDGSGAWKERGSGFIKVNVRDAEQDGDDAEEKDEQNKAIDGSKAKKKARFILRANGTNRLVLNSPVDKHTPFGQPGGNGAKPTGKGIMFMGVLDEGAMQTLQLSMAPDSAKSLWETVQQLRKDM